MLSVTDCLLEESYDVLYVSDGQRFQRYSSLSPLTGFKTATYYTSTQQYMLVRFIADDSVALRGFNAYYNTSWATG